MSQFRRASGAPYFPVAERTVSQVTAVAAGCPVRLVCVTVTGPSALVEKLQYTLTLHLQEQEKIDPG